MAAEDLNDCQKNFYALLRQYPSKIYSVFPIDNYYRKYETNWDEVRKGFLSVPLLLHTDWGWRKDIDEIIIGKTTDVEQDDVASELEDNEEMDKFLSSFTINES